MNWSAPCSVMREIVKQVGEELGVTRSEAELIVASLLDRPRFELYLKGEIPDAAAAMLRVKLAQFRRGVPLEYLTRKIQFVDLNLRIHPGVFIPRLETEYFVDLLPRKIGSAPASVLEVGTGCGAIALSLAAIYPGALIVATDISRRALNNARENIRIQGKTDRIALVQCDLLDGLKRRFDLIVSNPPYIPSDRIRSLPESVRSYEPLAALAGGRSGVKFIEDLIGRCRPYVHRGSTLALEIDSDEKPTLEKAVAVASLAGSFEPDLFGRVRFLFITGFKDE